MSFQEVCKALEELYPEAAAIHDGNNADYIPELASVNSDLFGIAVCSCNGEIWHIGDTDIPYTFQSTIKPLLYNVAINLVGEGEVHKHIGCEPSGQRFNAFVLDEDGNPHNPLINAGAIMSSAIIRSEVPTQVDSFKAVKTFAERCAGLVSPVQFDNSVFLSELNTASRNFALSYFMRERSDFLKTVSIERTLELYFSACALTINCKGMATVAATYASGGTCPVTRDQVIQPVHAKDTMQIMFSCGMYDYSGRFAFEVGIPAKSGVSGALMMSVPGKFGIGIWSPRLDKHGNTVRGLWIAKKLVERFPQLHLFGNAVERAKNALERQLRSDPGVPGAQFLIHAAATGNIETVQELVDKQNLDVNFADYDGRTALHLAMAEGHGQVARFLLDRGADPERKDRFGATPRSEALSTGLSDLLPPLPLSAMSKRKNSRMSNSPARDRGTLKQQSSLSSKSDSNKSSTTA